MGFSGKHDVFSAARFVVLAGHDDRAFVRRGSAVDEPLRVERPRSAGAIRYQLRNVSGIGGDQPGEIEHFAEGHAAEIEFEALRTVGEFRSDGSNSAVLLLRMGPTIISNWKSSGLLISVRTDVTSLRNSILGRRASERERACQPREVRQNSIDLPSLLFRLSAFGCVDSPDLRCEKASESAKGPSPLSSQRN